MSKVSDNYRICLSMANILYEEIFRFIFNTFMVQYSGSSNLINIIDGMKDPMVYETELLVMFDEFSKYVQNKIDDSQDKQWKLIMCYFKLMSLYKCYTNAMDNGDSLAMEYVETKFCGIFLLMQKHKYVEIVLSQMETRYLNIPFSQLQEYN